MTSNQDPMRIAREALEQAQQFIENGVESGYIRMPDQSLLDPAHKTLPAIRQALAQIDQLAPSREATADDDLVQVVARAIAHATMLDMDPKAEPLTDKQWAENSPEEAKFLMAVALAAITALDLPARLQAAKDAGREDAAGIARKDANELEQCLRAYYKYDSYEDKDIGALREAQRLHKAIRERMGEP